MGVDDGVGFDPARELFARFESDPAIASERDLALAAVRERLVGIATPTDAHQHVLSRYVSIGRIGAGGLGMVYAAYDPELDRRVAIKLIRARQGESEPAEAHDRLRLEAQALARLSHPNVVDVFDVRTYHGSDGEVGVFVVMELVDGVDVQAWLGESDRGWREIVPVFQQAGRGLVAAHESGVVHRDFKPSNVMVGTDGRVRVLDFGLARVYEPRGLDETPPLPTAGSAAVFESTIAQAVLGTPTYMAPEQHRGATADARSDQFAFCVSLYIALYGRPPYAGATVAELADAKDAGRILVPPRGHNVPGWLYRVIRIGLRPAPERRHATMQRLLDALDGGQRTRRLALFAGAAAGAAGAVWLALPAAANGCEPGAGDLQGVWDVEAKARTNAAFAATGQPYAHAAWATASNALDAYAEAWVAEHARVCAASEASVIRIQCLRERWGEFEAVARLLQSADETVVEHAGEAVVRLPSPDSCRPAANGNDAPGPSGIQGPEADRLRRLASNAWALQELGKWSQSRSEAAELIAGAREVGDPQLLAEVLGLLATTTHRDGDSEAAVPIYEQALVAAAQAEDHRLTAELSSWYGYVLGSGLGHFSRAHREFRHAAAALDRSGRDPRTHATMLMCQSGVLMMQGRHDDAHTTAVGALEIWEDLLGPDHPGTASALMDLGTIAGQQGHLAEGAALLRRALQGRERAFGQHHPLVASTLANLSGVTLELGLRREALALSERALSIREAALDPGHPDIAVSLCQLGNAACELGQPARALEAFERAREIYIARYGPNHRRVVEADLGLARALALSGRHADAQDAYLRATALSEQVLGPTHPMFGRALFNFGAYLAGRKLHVRALRAYVRAAEVLEQGLGGDDPLLGRALSNGAEIRLRLGDAAAAVEPLERATRILAGAMPNPDANAQLAMARFRLAIALDRTGAAARAITLARQAATTVDGNDGPAERAFRQEVDAWLATR